MAAGEEHTEREVLRGLLDYGLSVEAIGRRFGKHPSTIAYWMAKHGLIAPRRGKHAARGGIELAELASLVDAGRSIAEIALALDLSQATVRHWLRRHGLTTAASARAANARTARDARERTVAMTCATHGEGEFVLEGRGYYRCKRCRAERVADRRRRTKAILVSEAGGRCRICGYDRYVGALEFHHVDPTMKRLQISNGATAGLAKLRDEVRKCVLLCSNCHAEVEGGVVSVPLQFGLGEGDDTA